MRSSSTASFAATASSAESVSFGSRTRRKAFSVASFVIGRPSTTAQVSAVTAGSLGVVELQADARNTAASAPVRSVGVEICMSREAYCRNASRDKRRPSPRRQGSEHDLHPDLDLPRVHPRAGDHAEGRRPQRAARLVPDRVVAAG